MIKDNRVSVAAGLLTAVLSVVGAAQVHAAPLTPVRYACESYQNLVIQRDGKSAQVRFIDKSYVLSRKPSSIGVKYESGNAALIIDGPSAVFVAEDSVQLGTCLEAFPVASLR